LRAGFANLRGAAEPCYIEAPLIAYTDGLVERRETLDAGLRRLQVAAARNFSSPEDLLSSIVTELTGDSPTDDIALMGLTWLN
jgi:serine phosphatase RsbU (regulator of sigma subunit)